MTAVREPRNRGSAGLWTGMMLAAFGVIAALRMTDAVGPVTGYLLMACAMLLLIPLTRAQLAKQRRSGHVSPAVRRYTQRFLLASFGYVLGLGLAVTINDSFALQRGANFAIALLPVIPIFAMIWAMARYLGEEDDEYLRHRAMIASLGGLGVVLGAGSFWGFLETFDVVPHVDAWWTFPVWALGMGVAQCWMGLRDRSGKES